MGAASNGQRISRAIAEADAAVQAEGQSIAQVIGESVALHLGQLLGQMVASCYFCLADAQQVITGHSVAIRNAQAAGEPLPDVPAAPVVNRSVTFIPIVQMAQCPAGPMPVGCSVPACWDHLPPPALQSRGPVEVGLFGLDGQPLIFKRS